MLNTQNTRVMLKSVMSRLEKGEGRLSLSMQNVLLLSLFVPQSLDKGGEPVTLQMLLNCNF